ncbi:hypothetical protein GGR51DRAFT_570652 [Nemania sp. FL0031]|nr:hypothetical protein GGR51DRAFT_570652 [Nemania sp. FL0031]
MALEPTDGELEWFLGECEVALSIVRRIIAACPSDLVAKVALTPLDSSLRHLTDDVQGWLEGINERPLSAEHFDRLRRFVRQSRLSIIDPQARKIGLKVSKLKPAEQRNKNPSPYSIVHMFTLFVVQGFAFVVLDRFQTSPPWIGNRWVPQVASLVATYVLVLQHQTSWIPTLCYLVAQGLCVWMGDLLGLGGILGLVFMLTTIAAGSPSISRKNVR